jgi:conjugative relaxase-like TrwC/TraI family protein
MGACPMARWSGRSKGGAWVSISHFSMPKSASILALVSGDRRILDAHLAAVKSTMSQLVEKQFAESRNYERSRSGEPQKTGNLVYACSPMTRAARSIRRGTSTPSSPT